jgi:UrcA family protein
LSVVAAGSTAAKLINPPNSAAAPASCGSQQRLSPLIFKKDTIEMKRSLIAAALAASLVAAPAFAASDTFEMPVSYDRDALTTPEGAKAQYQIIRRQVAARCATENADMAIGHTFANTICTARTMDKAVKSIDSPQLTQVHAARKAR